MRQLLFASLLATSLLTTGCSFISGIGVDNNPKPTPLTNFTPEASLQTIWSDKTGKGIADNYLQLAPAYANNKVFTVDYTGRVTATNATNGQSLWSIDTKTAITSSPAAQQNYVIVGTQEGYVIALDSNSGKQLWRVSVPGQVLASPTIDKSSVYIKTMDSNVCALDLKTGKTFWVTAHLTPPIILRGSSAPQVVNNLVIVGFADGKLVAFEKDTGRQRWERAIAIPQGVSVAERMIDIDVDPIVSNGIVYVASYQGNIAAVNAISGASLWEHPLSSYAGATLDNTALYIADADSNLFAFDRKNGQVLWKQTKLFARRITGPAMINNIIVVGDSEGYLHGLSPEDGHFVSRIQVDKNGIIANPLSINNTLFVTTKNGALLALGIKK